MTRGGIVWLTGIPGAGKTTIAGILASKVRMKGGKAEILDGDEIRETISAGIGWDREGRRSNVRRISWIARRMARNDIWVIAAAVSPYREDRLEAKEAAAREGIPFIEVYLKCAVAAAQARDQKGLYKKWKEGAVVGVSGLDAPYEEPENAYVVDTGADSPDEAATRIWDAMLWRPEENPPIICVGKGHGGSRLVSKLMQDLGVFIGQHEQINDCEDSMEWVRLIYRMVEELGPVKELPKSTQYRDDIRNTGRLILRNGNVPAGSPWGWKLPETTLVVSIIAETFPKAKFIHCMRHPVSSCLRNPHLTSDPLQSVGRPAVQGAYEYCGRSSDEISSDPDWLRSAITWNHQTDRVVRYGREVLGSKRYLEVKYEDICASPDWAIGTLERFLGMTRVRRRSSVEIDKNRMNRWNPEDPRAAEIWKVCGEAAAKVGYAFLEGHDPSLATKKAGA